MSIWSSRRHVLYSDDPPWANATTQPPEPSPDHRTCTFSAPRCLPRSGTACVAAAVNHLHSITHASITAGTHAPPTRTTSHCISRCRLASMMMRPPPDQSINQPTNQPTNQCSHRVLVAAGNLRATRHPAHRSAFRWWPGPETAPKPLQAMWARERPLPGKDQNRFRPRPAGRWV